jgi:signal transduction histidine kinase
LMSGHEQVGLLLLGDRVDQGLYSEEEIEIARASGERLLDMLAVGETAQRLMLLLRQRIAESHVLEGQGRRVLHDLVLPQLHTAILYLSSAESGGTAERAIVPLSKAHRQISDLVHAASLSHSCELVEGELGAALRAFVASDLHDEFADVAWYLAPDAEDTARNLPLFVVEVLFFAARELIRNAARHGRGDSSSRELHLCVTMEVASGPTGELVLSIEDDGVGFPSSDETVHPADVRGGQGLRFHSAMLTAVGAQMQVMPSHMGGTQGLIVLPLNLWSEAGF